MLPRVARAIQHIVISCHHCSQSHLPGAGVANVFAVLPLVAGAGPAASAPRNFCSNCSKSRLISRWTSSDEPTFNAGPDATARLDGPTLPTEDLASIAATPPTVDILSVRPDAATDGAIDAADWSDVLRGVGVQSKPRMPVLNEKPNDCTHSTWT